MLHRGVQIGWLVIALTAACQNQQANLSANRANAARWVTDTLPGYTMVGFSSASLDVDGDGYVSADVAIQKPEGPLRLIQLECPTAGVLMAVEVGSGCKFVGAPLDNIF